jgi:hypothetical protein
MNVIYRGGGDVGGLGDRGEMIVAREAERFMCKREWSRRMGKGKKNGGKGWSGEATSSLVSS